MPRIARGLAGGEIYHIINRGNRRAEVFHNTKDYEKFIELMKTAQKHDIASTINPRGRPKSDKR